MNPQQSPQQHPVDRPIAIDQMADAVLALVRQHSHSNEVAAEALISALMRLLGPSDYASFLASMPASSSR